MQEKRFGVGGLLLHGAVLLSAVSVSLSATAQDGNAGINQANTMMRSYFTTATNLMYAIGAIMGLFGGIKVYRMITEGRHESWQALAAWFGGCIFLVLVATVIQSFFGL
jgi:hypothetical protein